MSTIATKLLTAEEFFDWVHQPENSDRYFELDRGEVIEMPPPGKYHGFVCGNVARLLGNYADRTGRGYVCTNDSGLVVERDPDSVRGPDVTFYDDDETAEDMERNYSSKPPLLAVEVMSPNDRVNKVMRKVGQLLAHGVPVVWVVDPESRDVSICRKGQEPKLLTDEDTIHAEDHLAGFECPIAEFFAMPGSKR